MRIVLSLIMGLGFAVSARADSAATITGRIVDPNELTVVGANVEAINIATNISYAGHTNSAGVYSLTGLPVGVYRISVEKSGFKSLQKTGVELHTEDVIALNFSLQIGSMSETITVSAGAPVVNTETATVSTVVDRQLVEALPLNGRSFNTLLQLTPGVVIAGSPDLGNVGQFNINGQRSDANYFSVDGVSANFGMVSPNGQSAGGTVPAFNVYGGTNGLASVDDVQEFRVQTSSFAPEYGRTPGGQVGISTRSGTDQFHGNLFDYFRNTVLDANDWFSNSAGLPRSPEQQNDFGGTFGGPVPKARAFFFFSYEGLRLLQPQATMPVNVPTVLARRSASSAAIQEILNAYPLPNGVPTSSPLIGTFVGSYSSPTTSNATSLRIDEKVGQKAALFFRYNYATSQVVARTLDFNTLQSTRGPVQTATVGSTILLSPTISTDIRGNYSKSNFIAGDRLDSFGGAVAPDLSVFVPSNASVFFWVGPYHYMQAGPVPSASQVQFNILDTTSVTIGVHQLKFGVDYRRLLPHFAPFSQIQYEENSFSSSKLSSFLGSDVFPIGRGIQQGRVDLTYNQFSLFAQDTWKLGSRISLTYGLRWEFNPPPTGRDGSVLYTFNNLDNLQNLSLAAAGSALWKKRYNDFAPRLGVAYQILPNHDFVFRAGAGVFYDLGVGIASFSNYFPNRPEVTHTNVTVPVQDPGALIPPISLSPPYASASAISPSLELPYSIGWNAAVEKGLGKYQSISVTYVGQVGRRLLTNQENDAPPSPPFLTNQLFQVTENGASSSYHALQLQFRRQFAKNVQGLVNYTWSHSIDNDSSDLNVATTSALSLLRGPSDFDIRHNFTAAAVYNIPFPWGKGFRGAPFRDWSVDLVMQARSGFPINVTTGQSPLLPPSASGFNTQVDYVPGQPFWISTPGAPGCKVLNPAAFAIPATLEGSLGRNSIPGFGATQIDLSLARTVNFTERLHLQVRGDVFNVFNHPNFANPDSVFDDFPGTFGFSRSMLNRGLGGLSPLYQIGGPRSAQLSLKLQF